MAGFILGRGNWEIRDFTVATASNFSQGTAVCISNATGREISEYSGGQQGMLGISLAASANSLPSGKIQVAIPRDRTCTAFADFPAGIAASALSMFETYGLYKVGGVTSCITTAYTSAVSRQVQIIGPASTSGSSKVEVAFTALANQYGSLSTTSIQ